MLMRLMSKSEYLIVPKGTKFTGAGKLGLKALLLKKKKKKNTKIHNDQAYTIYVVLVAVILFCMFFLSNKLFWHAWMNPACNMFNFFPLLVKNNAQKILTLPEFTDKNYLCPIMNNSTSTYHSLYVQHNEQGSPFV